MTPQVCPPNYFLRWDFLWHFLSNRPLNCVPKCLCTLDCFALPFSPFIIPVFFPKQTTNLCFRSLTDFPWNILEIWSPESLLGAHSRQRWERFLNTMQDKFENHLHIGNIVSIIGVSLGLTLQVSDSSRACIITSSQDDLSTKWD